MTLHPYLASTSDPFHRLVRANYWLVTDRDWRNTQYWRDQVRLCEEGYLFAFLGSPAMPADVRARREKLMAEQVGVALREGYAAAGRFWHRGGTDVPVISCS